mgnify:CR=1 FL=1
MTPSVISFQKAKEQRDQYLNNHQKAEEHSSIEDLLPPDMKEPKAVDNALQRIKKKLSQVLKELE